MIEQILKMTMATDGKSEKVIEKVLHERNGFFLHAQDIRVHLPAGEQQGIKFGFFGIFDRTVRPVWSGPLLASNRLVLTNSDGELVAFDPKTGAQTASLKLGGPVYIAPAAYNGALYVLTDKGQLVSIR